MSFFEKLLKKVADEEKHTLSSCLLQAKVLASKLRSPKFRRWLDAELAGYARREQVPDYRIVRSLLYGDFAGPFQSAVRHVLLSTNGLPSELRDVIDNYAFTDNIGQLEAMLETETDTLYHPWGAELVEQLRLWPGVRIDGYVLNSATSHFPRAAIRGVLYAIRKRLLDFLIELSEKYPDLEKSEEAVANVPPDATGEIFDQNITNINIQVMRDLSIGGNSSIAGTIQDNLNEIAAVKSPLL